MSKFVTKNARCFVGAYDLSGDCNKMDISYSCEVKEITNLLSVWKEKIPGLKDFKVSYGGFLNTGAANLSAEEAHFNYTGLENVPVLLCPTSGTDGEIVYFGKAISTNYKLLGAVGEVAPFEVSAEGQGNLIRGKVLKVGTVNATGNGTAVLHTAVGASQYLYGQLHVYSVSGTNPSITVKIQSDDNSGFTSATDRITFAAKTAIGYEFATPIAGAITDTYYRVNYTVSGTNPVFGVAVVMGIL